MLERLAGLFFRSLLFAIVTLSIAGRLCEADFTTIINVPPDTSPSMIGSHTQLNLFDGGTLSGGFEAGDADGSSVDVEVNLFGGTIGPDGLAGLTAYRGSVINMHGPLEGGLARADGAVWNMHSGHISLSASNSAEVNIFGGTIPNLNVFGGSTVNQRGGAVTTDLNTLSGEGSVWNLYDGEIENRFEMTDGAQMNMYGGQIGYRFYVDSGTTMNIFGGTVSLGPDTDWDYAFIAGSDSSVNVHGGFFRENVLVGEGSHFNLFVKELFLDGVPFPLVPGEQTIIPNANNVLLEAILADGTFLDLGLGSGPPGLDSFAEGAIITATLVPEPSTSVLAILAALGVIGMRSRHRRGRAS